MSVSAAEIIHSAARRIVREGKRGDGTQIRTSNIQRPTLNVEQEKEIRKNFFFDLRRWTFDVECSTFILFFAKFHRGKKGRTQGSPLRDRRA
jgi:hypothetical protein